MRKTSLGLITVMLAALMGSALADAVADGEAGLTALKSGDYSKAIIFFTRALKGNQLKSADREFAYLSRGKAYLRSGKPVPAISDLKMAVKLAPDDSEAADTLAQAQSANSRSATDSDAPRRSRSTAEGGVSWCRKLISIIGFRRRMLAHTNTWFMPIGSFRNRPWVTQFPRTVALNKQASTNSILRPEILSRSRLTTVAALTTAPRLLMAKH